MCNRYRVTADDAALIARYGLSPLGEFEKLPPPEMFPKKPAYVVRRDDNGTRRLAVMAWGFPHTVKTKTGKLVEKPVTNVRNLSSSFWRSALATPGRRCLVPVTSFSEYGPGEPGKLPLHWFDVPSVPIFSFAGIWRPVPGGAVFAFLTCEPNVLIAPIHPKAMPVILHVDNEDRWLNADLDEALALVAPFPSQLMTVSAAEDSKS